MQYTDFRSVDGKVAVVTGGANGIGQAIVELFAQNGMKVVIADISDEDGEKLVAKIKKEGGEVSYHHTDVSSEESIADLMRFALETYGKLNVVVNNAGIGTALHPVHEYDSAQFKKVTDLNYIGTFLGMKYGVKAMLKSMAKECAIINIASAGALSSSGNYTCYDASKAAVIHLSKEAGLDYAKHDITVNAICPGVIETAIYSKLSKIQVERSLSKVPMTRFGRPEEIAYMALFLASDMARFITGSVFAVDAGQHVGTYLDFEWETKDPRI